MSRNECPDCGSTNGAPLCVAGKCLMQKIHTECDTSCVAVKAQLDQAATGTDNMIRGHISELKNQLESGYSEEQIMVGMQDFLLKFTDFNREEFATLYMRAVFMLAKDTAKQSKLYR